MHQRRGLWLTVARRVPVGGSGSGSGAFSASGGGGQEKPFDRRSQQHLPLALTIGQFRQQRIPAHAAATAHLAEQFVLHQLRHHGFRLVVEGGEGGAEQVGKIPGWRSSGISFAQTCSAALRSASRRSITLRVRPPYSALGMQGSSQSTVCKVSG